MQNFNKFGNSNNNNNNNKGQALWCCHHGSSHYECSRATGGRRHFDQADQLEPQACL